MKKILLIVPLAVLAACRGNVGGHHHDHDEESHTRGSEIVIEPEKAEKLGIRTTTAAAAPFSGIIRTAGRIENDRSRSWDIVADCSGKITYLVPSMTEGKEVSRGESLFMASSATMNSQNINAELETARAELEQAKAEYDRTGKLRSDRLATESELLLARREYETAKTKFDRLSRAAVQRLSSPSDGFITSLKVENGRYVEEGTVIATVSTGKDLIVEAFLPARYAASAGHITGANFKAASIDTVITAEHLTATSDIVSEGGTYIPVHFRTKKAPGLTAGLPVEVFIKTGGDRRSIAVPVEAVTEKYGHYYLYVKPDEDCYVQREVTIGENDGRNVEILSGISEGEEIVTEGVYYVRMSGSGSSIPHGHSH